MIVRASSPVGMRPRAIRVWAAVTVLVALLGSRMVQAEVPAALVGRSIVAIDLRADARVRDASGTLVPTEQLVRMAAPLRAGATLTPELVERAVRNLYERQWFARVGVLAEADGEGARIHLHLEPRRRVVDLQVRGNKVLEAGALRRAAGLALGTEFSPERMESAATGIARAYFRAGWREAIVTWSVVPDGDELRAVFGVEEGLPTTLVQLEFEGTDGLGLVPTELGAAFEIEEDQAVSLDVLDRGIEELRDRYRRRGFYRAKVQPPQVQAADGRAVVLVKVEPGPRFELQLRGNRSFDDRLLLEQLRYTGNDPLDASLQRTLADRLRLFYELAGFPNASVTVREAAPPAVPGSGTTSEEGGCGGGGRVVRYVARGGPRSSGPEGGLALIGRGGRARPWRGDDEPVESFREPRAGPPERSGAVAAEARLCLVTFAIAEKSPVRVIERTFPGATVFTYEELDRRVDVVLDDTQPPVLREDRNRAIHHEAGLSGVPGEKRAAPRDRPAREVFAESPYRVASDQIADLYKSQGYLEVRVGPAQLQPVAQETARVVMPVVEGRQTVVSSVKLDEAPGFDPAELRSVVALKTGDPLSFFAVEESRNALEAFFRKRGHLFARVEDDVEIDEAEPKAQVLFRLEPGDLTRVERVRFEGLNARTDEEFLREKAALQPGDVLTPERIEEVSRSLGTTGIFSSVAVRLGETATDEAVAAPTKPVIVFAREKPTIAWEARVGASEVDGVRGAAQAVVNNAFGRGQTVNASAKVNYPFWRLARDAETCPSCVPVDIVDRVERRIYLGVGWPGLLDFLGDANVRLDAVHENVIRPAYRLSKFALVLTTDGLRLPLAPLFGGLPLGELSAILQGEVEFDDYAARRGLSSALSFTQADRQAALLPEGTLVLGSLRPTLTWDARSDPGPAATGFLGSVLLDFARSFAARTTAGDAFLVSLVRVLATASVNIALPSPTGRRIILALGGRFGGILRDPSTYVVGTKRFFLGGFQTLRGFNEDGVYAQDVRVGLQQAVSQCAALLSGAGCGPGIANIQRGLLTPPEGGTLLATGRAELRVGLAGDTDVSTFVDAGNLWLDPGAANLAVLRVGLGAGLRVGSPIGAVAIEVGVNPWADAVVLEPLWRLHVSIGQF